MDLVNALVALVGVCVTAIAAWTSTRTTRARRRAEEAQLALQLLSLSRSTEGVIHVDRVRQQRLDHAARFATSEFTRLILSDGPRWWTIIPIAAYGAGLIVAVIFATEPAAAAVFSVTAFICAGYAAAAAWIKYRRSRRLREAGVPVPTIRELWRKERCEWNDVRAARRARSRRRGTPETAPANSTGYRGYQRRS